MGTEPNTGMGRFYTCLLYTSIVKVSVGSVEHPSTEEHYIAWVYLETAHGGQRKAIKPGDKPEVSFALQDDELIAVYAYCNLHGLWKTEIKK